MRVELLASATRGDLALACVMTLLIQGLGALGLSAELPSQRSAAAPEHPWAVPVQLQVAAPQPPPPPAPQLINPRIKLGGGSPDGRGHGRRDSVPAPDAVRQTPVATRSPAPPLSAAQTRGTTPAPNTTPSLEPLPSPESELSGGSGGSLASDGTAGSTDAPPGPGFPDGEPGGTVTDPLQAHAIRLYRGRVQAWFAERFRLTGTGLAQAELLRLRAVATVTIASNRRVASSTLTSSGNPRFDAAVRRVLDGVHGLEIPPPPEHYPGVLRGHLQVTFVCGENTCD